jgi:hypothetical protein
MQKFAFLLISLILISTISFAAAPVVSQGGPYTGHRNENIDLNGYATNPGSTITSIGWTVPTECSIVDEFVDVQGDQHKADAVITCTDIVQGGNVSLKADNNNSETTTETASLEISNRNPIAILDVSPDSGDPPLTVTLNGFCEDLDGNGTINTCFLDYGDGNGEAIASPYNFSKNHIYYTVGQHPAKLMVNDDQDANANACPSCTDSESITVNGANQAPVASNVQLSPSSPATNNDLTCNYDYSDAESDPDDSTTFLWFRDGVATSNTSKTLASSQTLSGETWKCQVTPGTSTGTSPGTDVNSNTVTIGSVAKPNISSPTHSEDEWESSDDPEFNWSSVAGATYYYVLDTSSGTTVTESNSDGSTTSTSITYSSQSNGEKWFHLRAKVGSEWSSTDHYKIKIDDQDPSTPDLHTADPGDEEVYLDWGSSSDSHSGVKEYLVYKNGSYVTTTTATDYTVDNLDNGIEYDFKVRARDNAGNTSDYSDIVEVTPSESGSNDTTAPNLSWENPDDDDTVSGSVLLKVWAYDDESNIKFVKFYVDGVNVGTDTTAISERYSIDWDSSSVADGEHELKAIAKTWSGDEEHNSRFRTIEVRTDNGVEAEDLGEGTVFADQDKQLAKEAIDKAGEEKETVESLIEELELLGVSLSDDVVAEFDSAEESLEDSLKNWDDEEYVECKDKAKEAAQGFENVQGMVGIEDYGSVSEYVYNKEHIDILLQGIGLSQELSQEAEENMQNSEVKRTLEIKKILNGDSTGYRAIIVISVKNNSEELEEFRVVEVIPKEFAESASEIVEDSFTVVEDDPVLAWSLSLSAGQESQISYVLAENLTEEEANEMLESDTLNKFKAPPVLMDAGTEVTKESFSGADTGLFGLGDGLAMAGWAILIIAIIGAALYAFNHFLQREQATGLDATGSGKGFGKGLLGNLGSGRKKEDKPEGGKWAYKD